MEVQQALQRKLDTNKLEQVFPDEGPFKRSLYPKHIAFFAAGSSYLERAIVAANRVGKTVCGAYECAVHLTGCYPAWWPGRRFLDPVDVWAAGETSETTRDIVQGTLMGPLGQLGTGLIPARSIIGEPSKRMGVSGAMDTALVAHKSGGTSQVGFKSYDQGPTKFQGVAKHVIWLDEEPSASVYDECLLRLMTTNGLMMCTFTPLLGLSDVALRFLPALAPVTD